MEDISGNKYKWWTVISYNGSEKWNCVCQCGTERPVFRSSLVRGRSKSCGCYKSPHDDLYNERFKTRLKRNMSVNESECWIWNGSIMPSGYGQISHKTNKSMRTHRAAWMAWKGEIPKGMYVLHKCDVRNCINPDHLFLGTHEDNMKDMKLKNRACKGVNSHLHAVNRRKKNEESNSSTK